MRPWMLKELERERRKIEREREQRQEQLLALGASNHPPNEDWRAQDQEKAMNGNLVVRRGVWITDL